MIAKTLLKRYGEEKVMAGLFLAILACALAFFAIQPPSLSAHLAVFIWAFCAVLAVYLTKRKGKDSILTKNERRMLLTGGVFSAILSFAFIPTGLGNAPYSLDDFSLLLAGIAMIFVSEIGKKKYAIPAIIPTVAIVSFQIYDKLIPVLEEVSAPLRYPVIQLSAGMLRLFGVDAVGEESRVLFTTLEGYPVGVPIVFECTGVESMSTFLLAAAVVFYMFRDMPRNKKLMFLAIGIAGTYAANILRIVAICMSGYYFGVGGMMKLVHIHAGWVAFSSWMFIFWYAFFRSYMKGQKKGKDAEHKARGGKAGGNK